MSVDAERLRRLNEIKLRALVRAHLDAIAAPGAPTVDGAGRGAGPGRMRRS